MVSQHELSGRLLAYHIQGPSLNCHGHFKSGLEERPNVLTWLRYVPEEYPLSQRKAQPFHRSISLPKRSPLLSRMLINWELSNF